MHKYGVVFCGMILLFSCSNKDRFKYSISDFKPSLQPHLRQIVHNGYPTAHDTVLHISCSEQELEKLSFSEHPMLRAAALKELLERKCFDGSELILKHIEDTSLVPYDAGEWGVGMSCIMDQIILHSTWKTPEAKQIIVDSMLLHHNHFRTAYRILEYFEPGELHYNSIKDMAIRDRKSIGDLNHIWLPDFELALFGLAKYRKTKDISIIKEQLLKQSHSISSLGFRLLKKFPDSSYMEIFEKLYPHDFNYWIFRDNNFNYAVDFINSISTYKNERSARILAAIIKDKRFIDPCYGKGNIRHSAIRAIWENKCEAYRSLMDITKKEGLKHLKNREKFSIEIPVLKLDSGEKVYSWLYQYP